MCERWNSEEMPSRSARGRDDEGGASSSLRCDVEGFEGGRDVEGWGVAGREGGRGGED